MMLLEAVVQLFGYTTCSTKISLLNATNTLLFTTLHAQPIQHASKSGNYKSNMFRDIVGRKRLWKTQPISSTAVCEDVRQVL